MIVGIDPGVNAFGIAQISNDGRRVLFSEQVNLPSRKPLPERLQALGDHIANTLDRVPTDTVVGIEIPVVGVNKKTAIIQGRTVGVIERVVHETELRYVTVYPTQVKQAMTGDGHASKLEMQTWAQRRFDLSELIGEDEADAIGVALATADVLARERWGTNR